MTSPQSSRSFANRETGAEELKDEFCRICQQAESSEKLLATCYCKGTMGLIHISCLEHWLQESGKSICELCGYEYTTVRVPKYSVCRSVCLWIKNPGSPELARSLWFDIAAFIAFTPLAALCTYICVVATKHYTRLDRPGKVPLQWTSLGILLFMSAIDIVYTIWIVLRLRHQLSVWYLWYKRHSIVQVVLPSPGMKLREVPSTEEEQITSEDLV